MRKGASIAALAALGLLLSLWILPAVFPRLWAKLDPVEGECWMVLAHGTPEDLRLVKAEAGTVVTVYDSARAHANSDFELTCPKYEVLAQRLNSGGRFDQVEWEERSGGRFWLTTVRDDVGGEEMGYLYACDLSDGFVPLVSYSRLGPLWIPHVGGRAVLVLALVWAGIGFWMWRRGRMAKVRG